MTVRVTVKTHGCPCTVQVDGADPVTVDHHQQSTFDVSGEASLKIVEEEPSADHGVAKHPDAPLDPNEVPGRAENDARLGKVETNKTKPLKGELPADESDKPTS